MAKPTSQAPLSALVPMPDDDEAMQASRQKYIDAQTKMLEALQARNQFIDPRNLAVAQAFLQPTKSGRFGESLGNVLSAYSGAEEAERKRNIEMAQIQADLAAQELGANREAQAIKQFNRMLGAPSDTQKTSDQPQSGQVSSAGVAPPPTAGYAPPTAQSIAMLKRLKPEYGKIIEEMIKFDQDRYLIAMNGTVFDKRTGQYVNPENIPGQTQSEFELPGLGKFLMTPNEYSMAMRGRSQAAAEGWREDWDRQFRSGSEPSQIKQPGAPAQPKEASAQTPAAQGRQTTTEAQLQREAALTTAQERAKADERSRQEALQRGDTALQRRQAAEQVIELSKAPGMDQALAVFEKPGFIPAVGKLIDEGFNLGRGFGISVPQLRDVFTANNIKLPKLAGETTEQYDQRVNKVLDNLSLLSSRFAEISFGFRAMAQGQGSISNFEQLIFSSMGPTVRDRPRTIQAKAQHMIERANFEEKVRDALANSSMTFNQFRGSDDYQRMVKEYDDRLRNLYQGMASGEDQPARGPVIQPTRPVAPVSGRGAPGTERMIDGQIHVRINGRWVPKGRE